MAIDMFYWRTVIRRVDMSSAYICPICHGPISGGCRNILDIYSYIYFYIYICNPECLL